MSDERPGSKLVTLRRRDALKGLAAAPAVAAAGTAQAAPAPAPSAPAPPPRTLTDPDLLSPTVPWAKVLTPEERVTLTAICDTILPGDARSPAASALGVVAFVDEWIGAPYPKQQDDQVLLRGGLSWLNTEATKRFRKPFAALAEGQRHQICDDVCAPARARPAFRAAALFFDRLRNLCLSVFCTSEEGMKDLGYVGNAPSASFAGPPPEVLRRLKLG